MRKIDAILLLDVQDDFHPPEVGSDDIIKDFADAFAERHLVANFLFFANRSLLLKQRERGDVIRSLDGHCVGVHGPSNAHPCLPEYASQGDWFSALREVRRREEEGANIIRDVFGRDPCAISQHGYSTAPHVLAAAAEMGLPYIYAYPAAPPKWSISWYAGALNFPWSPDPNRRVPFFEVGDESWSDDRLFENALGRFEAAIEWCASSRQPFLSIFLSHPYRVRVIESVEYWQYINGRNIPRHLWGGNGTPRLRSEEQMTVARANIRRMAERLRNDSRLNIVGIPEAAERYGHQPKEISKGYLRKVVGELRRHRAEYAPDVSAAQDRPPLDIPIVGEFSPAEMLLSLADSLVAYARGEGLPSVVNRRDAMGPVENPLIAPEQRELDWNRFVEYLHVLIETVEKTGYLPANVGPEGARVGIGSLLRAMAEAFHEIERSSAPSRVLLPRFPRYPSVGRELGRLYADVVEWEMIEPELNAWNLMKYGKLQSWTLKPAWGLIGD